MHGKKHPGLSDTTDVPASIIWSTASTWEEEGIEKGMLNDLLEIKDAISDQCRVDGLWSCHV
jgi:hypothetical protein